jgi:hypothetical protein
LRDSIQNVLSTMPGLSGKDLAARSQAHIDRMRRMMVLGMGMMPAGLVAASLAVNGGSRFESLPVRVPQESAVFAIRSYDAAREIQYYCL